MELEIKKREEMLVCPESSVPELVEQSSVVIDESSGLKETTAGQPMIPIKQDDQGLGDEYTESYTDDPLIPDLVGRFFRPLQSGDRIRCRYVFDVDTAKRQSTYLGEVHTTFMRGGEILVPKRLLEGRHGIHTSPYQTKETRHITLPTHDFSLETILGLLSDYLHSQIEFYNEEAIEQAIDSGVLKYHEERMWLMYVSYYHFVLS